MANPASVEFQFVNSTISSPTVPQNAEVRALIRRQAMKKASEKRRREGNYGKHNLRQYPVFVYDNGSSGSSTSPEVQEKAWDKDLADGTRKWVGDGRINTKHAVIPRDGFKNAPGSSIKAHKAVEDRIRLKKAVMLEVIPPSVSADGYEHKSMQSDFDILDLSTLATLHIGRVVRGALSQNPYHLVSQLRSHKRWSYLSFLPTRYEHTKCLRDATDCVIARARQITLNKKHWEPAVLGFYLRALHSLQKALDSPKERFSPEVLCATEILALYEMLDPTGETAWVRHSAGAAKLIQLRGHKNYDTEFEKALFMAQTVPIMTECLLRNERCWLEQTAWQAVMKSMIDPTALITDRSAICVNLLRNKCQIPGIGFDVTSIICTSQPPSPQKIQDTIKNIRRLRTNLLSWRKEYDEVLRICPDLEPGTANHDSHCKQYANYLSCVMITSRFLVAIDHESRLEVETYTQFLASEMVELERSVGVSEGPTNLFMAQTLAVAKSVLATREDWLDGDGDEGGLIRRRKLERWCGMFGRKMPRY